MTGYAEKAAAGGFFASGMEDLLTKPFPIEILIERTRQMLDLRGAKSGD